MMNIDRQNTFIKFYPAHTHGYYFDQYHVVVKRKGSREPAVLLKAFYSHKNANKYRDMLNGKIPRDDKWMSEV